MFYAESSLGYSFSTLWITSLYIQLQMNPNRGLKILLQMHSLQKKMFVMLTQWMRLTEWQVIHDSGTKLNATVKVHCCVISIHSFSEGKIKTEQGSKESLNVLCYQSLTLEVCLYSRICTPFTNEGSYYTKGKTFIVSWALRMCDQT